MTRLGLLSLVLFSLMGCGRYNAGGQPTRPPVEPTPPPVVEGRRTTLIVFGAGYCGDCKINFPVISQGIANLPASKRQFLDVKMYYTAGDPGSIHPTQSGADSYRDAHFVLATPFPDLPWRWANFKKYLPGKPLLVPAAVVLDSDNLVVKTYTAGSTTFVPAEILAFVEAQIKAQ